MLRLSLPSSVDEVAILSLSQAVFHGINFQIVSMDWLKGSNLPEIHGFKHGLILQTYYNTYIYMYIIIYIYIHYILYGNSINVHTSVPSTLDNPGNQLHRTAVL